LFLLLFFPQQPRKYKNCKKGRGRRLQEGNKKNPGFFFFFLPSFFPNSDPFVSPAFFPPNNRENTKTAKREGEDDCRKETRKTQEII
jgi:hypothetical protein